MKKNNLLERQLSSTCSNFWPPGKGRSGQSQALLLSTLAFAVCFAVWGLLAGLMPIIKAELSLTFAQAGLLVAAPVILGSLGRIPIGILADRLGPAKVFSALLFVSVIPATALGLATSYWSLLIVGSFLGIAGTSFVVGVTYVSRYYPPQHHGTALGIYGLGNLGHSLAVFGAPALAALIGFKWAAWVFAAACLAYAFVFKAKSREPEWHEKPTQLMQTYKSFFFRPIGWTLSMFYFATFGGFVSLAIYLPMLLKDMYGLSALDAGFRTAMFAVLATIVRPLGGFLADRIGAKGVLGAVFLGLIPCALLMSMTNFGYFSVGALGAAVMLGLGNGALFKLIPSCFPQAIGTVTGLIGAAGGLGGFFPPILLGYAMDVFATYAPAFYAMAGFSLVCFCLLISVIQPSSKSS